MHVIPVAAGLPQAITKYTAGQWSADKPGIYEFYVTVTTQDGKTLMSEKGKFFAVPDDADLNPLAQEYIGYQYGLGNAPERAQVTSRYGSINKDFPQAAKPADYERAPVTAPRYQSASSTVTHPSSDELYREFQKLKVLPHRDRALEEFWQRVRNVGTPLMDENQRNGKNEIPVVFLYRQGEEYKDPIESVALAGDMTGWWKKDNRPFVKLQGTDLWYLEESFDARTRLDYRLVLNNHNLILDPLNPRTSATKHRKYYIDNSELAMPDFKEAQELKSKLKRKPRVEKISVFSEYLKYPHNVLVYLPPNYNKADSSKKYPTVYFQDGKDYLRLTNAARVLDNLITSKKIEPVIGVFVVPPKETNKNRVTEYMMNNKYVRFFARELVTFIDMHYHTRKDSSSRLVVGYCYGGLISLYIALRFARLFGKVASQSGYVSYKHGQIFHKLKPYFTRSQPPAPISFYLSAGKYSTNIRVNGDKLEYNFLDDNCNLQMALAAAEFKDVEYRELYDGHSWGCWRNELPDILRHFFPNKNAAGVSRRTGKKSSSALSFRNRINSLGHNRLRQLNGQGTSSVAGGSLGSAAAELESSWFSNSSWLKPRLDKSWFRNTLLRKPRSLDKSWPGSTLARGSWFGVQSAKATQSVPRHSLYTSRQPHIFFTPIVSVYRQKPLQVTLLPSLASHHNGKPRFVKPASSSVRSTIQEIRTLDDVYATMQGPDRAAAAVEMIVHSEGYLVGQRQRIHLGNPWSNKKVRISGGWKNHGKNVTVIEEYRDERRMRRYRGPHQLNRYIFLYLYDRVHHRLYRPQRVSGSGNVRWFKKTTREKSYIQGNVYIGRKHKGKEVECIPLDRDNPLNFEVRSLSNDILFSRNRQASSVVDFRLSRIDRVLRQRLVEALKQVGMPTETLMQQALPAAVTAMRMVAPPQTTKFNASSSIAVAARTEANPNRPERNDDVYISRVLRTNELVLAGVVDGFDGRGRWGTTAGKVVARELERFISRKIKSHGAGALSQKWLIREALVPAAYSAQNRLVKTLRIYKRKGLLAAEKTQDTRDIGAAFTVALLWKQPETHKIMFIGLQAGDTQALAYDQAKDTLSVLTIANVNNYYGARDIKKHKGYSWQVINSMEEPFGLKSTRNISQVAARKKTMLDLYNIKEYARVAKGRGNEAANKLFKQRNAAGNTISCYVSPTVVIGRYPYFPVVFTHAFDANVPLGIYFLTDGFIDSFVLDDILEITRTKQSAEIQIQNLFARLNGQKRLISDGLRRAFVDIFNYLCNVRGRLQPSANFDSFLSKLKGVLKKVEQELGDYHAGKVLYPGGYDIALCAAELKKVFEDLHQYLFPAEKTAERYSRVQQALGFLEQFSQSSGFRYKPDDATAVIVQLSNRHGGVQQRASSSANNGGEKVRLRKELADVVARRRHLENELRAIRENEKRLRIGLAGAEQARVRAIRKEEHARSVEKRLGVRAKPADIKAAMSDVAACRRVTRQARKSEAKLRAALVKAEKTKRSHAETLSRRIEDLMERQVQLIKTLEALENGDSRSSSSSVSDDFYSEGLTLKVLADGRYKIIMEVSAGTRDVYDGIGELYDLQCGPLKLFRLAGPWRYWLREGGDFMLQGIKEVTLRGGELTVSEEDYTKRDAQLDQAFNLAVAQIVLWQRSLGKEFNLTVEFSPGRVEIHVVRGDNDQIVQVNKNLESSLAQLALACYRWLHSHEGLVYLPEPLTDFARRLSQNPRTLLASSASGFGRLSRSWPGASSGVKNKAFIIPVVDVGGTHTRVGYVLANIGDSSKIEHLQLLDVEMIDNPKTKDQQGLADLAGILDEVEKMLRSSYQRVQAAYPQYTLIKTIGVSLPGAWMETGYIYPGTSPNIPGLEQCNVAKVLADRLGTGWRVAVNNDGIMHLLSILHYLLIHKKSFGDHIEKKLDENAKVVGFIPGTGFGAGAFQIHNHQAIPLPGPQQFSDIILSAAADKDGWMRPDVYTAEDLATSGGFERLAQKNELSKLLPSGQLNRQVIRKLALGTYKGFLPVAPMRTAEAVTRKMFEDEGKAVASLMILAHEGGRKGASRKCVVNDPPALEEDFWK
ncbi:MAG: hypothetical protein KKF80_00305, partial [Candidatus Omnitrophica bacterium]|nr:hypothetical protein [Candidatus Omnitrophota bacterium]